MTALLVVIGLLLVLALTFPLWRRRVQQTKWGVLLAYFVHSIIRRLGIGTTQVGFQPPGDLSRLDDDLRRIHRTFEVIRQQLGIQPTDLVGKRYLEVGSGANIGVGLLLAVHGCSEVVCLEKFVPFQQTEYMRQLYLRLRDGLSPAHQSAFDEIIDLTTEVKLLGDRVRFVRQSIIDPDLSFPDAYFDYISSCAVLMEIHEIDTVFAQLDRILKPGGQMTHTIDLSDYGMFSNRGYHKLEALTVPDWIYRICTASEGLSNRRLKDYYQDVMKRYSYEGGLVVQWTLFAERPYDPPLEVLEKGKHYGERELAYVAEIRPRLLPKYRALPDEDLIVSGIIMNAKKPM